MKLNIFHIVNFSDKNRYKIQIFRVADCIDGDSRVCEDLANKGNCESDSDWMIKNCCETCTKRKAPKGKCLKILVIYIYIL